MISHYLAASSHISDNCAGISDVSFDLCSSERMDSSFVVPYIHFPDVEMNTLGGVEDRLIAFTSIEVVRTRLWITFANQKVNTN